MDVFDVYAKLSLKSDEYDEGLNNAKNKATEFGNTLLNGLGSAVAAVGTATVAAVTAAGAAVGTIVQQAVESYANYEQQVGGVETIFKDSADAVKNYAEQSFQSAGISANQYMETVTSFSAALIQSLNGDTSQAAEVANMALIDMADNANKMGTAIESIQFAYQGFAKQNYTMLDNLKLGYGGTKEEMERLLEDAEKLTGIKYDITNLSDVYNAIHAIQTELGITGTTALEASTTISGALNMLKASWQDLLTSIAGGGQEMTIAINNLVASAETFATNLIPVIQQSLYGIANVITGIAPIIATAIPELINTLVPVFLDAVMTIVESIVSSLPSILSTIVDSISGILPNLVEVFISIFDTLLSTLLPAIMNLAIQLVLALGEGISNNANRVISSVISLLDYIIQTFLNNLPMIITVGSQLLLAIVEGLMFNMQRISDAVMSIVATIIQIILENLPEFLELGVKILANIALGIVMAIPMLLVSIGRVLGIVDDAKSKVATGTNDINSLANQSESYVSNSMSQISTMFDDTHNSIENKTNQIIDLTSETKENAKEISDDIVSAARATKTSVNEFIISGVIVTMYSGLDVAREFIDEFEKIIKHAIELIEELGEAEAHPTLDPSSIIDGCESIVNAVDEAIDALNSLGSASGSASFNYGGGHATGGWMTAGTSYLVGELGPELITPTKSGYVHTAEETASMLNGRNSGQSYVININGDVYDDARSMKQKFRNAMIDVLQEQVLYG